ncbi:MAG TPA: hypothetical protein VMF32_16750 [Xanthobacteraceae bacterium]|nr:hypothetical protein [Xanthobacteraceae bacterium]
MRSLFKDFDSASSTRREATRFTTADSVRSSDTRRLALRSVGGAARFPKRPDLTVLSETIPLFYIARNSRGFWVARDAERGCGGIFVLRRSAVHFARTKTGPAGCAMMFLNDALELDTQNEGSRLVEPMNRAIDVAWRWTPTLAAFVAMAIGEWRRLVARVSCAFAGERRNRAAVESELFRGQYTLISKHDDDLPVP